MYMDKEVKRGYNEYLRLDEGEGKDGMMDVALLVMEAGDTYTIEEADKEVACLLFDGDVNHELGRPERRHGSPESVRLQPVVPAGSQADQDCHHRKGSV